MNKGFLIFLAALLSVGDAKAVEKSLTITNQRELYPIMWIFIAPAGQSSWGEDQLGGATLSAGQSRTWTIPWRGCHVKVLARTFTGLTVKRDKLNICGGNEWTIYDDDNSTSEMAKAATVGAQGEMSWAIQDNCNNREAIRFIFVTDNADMRWPPGREFLYTRNFGETYVQRLSCPAGRYVCYGAWQSNHRNVWGAGSNGTDRCADCCRMCDGNEHRVSLACR